MTVTNSPENTLTQDYIDSDGSLRTLCAELASQPWLAIDTEFLRERTYYAQLCLIQIAAPERIVCIDPLAVHDLDPLGQLLATRQQHILHAARQDLEVIWQRMQLLPGVLFDTQLAAAFCGYGDQVSYAALVSELVGVDLPKAHTRTDWTRRPLSVEQIRYARSDVEFLPVLYERFAELLDKLGRTAWFEEECRILLDTNLYQQQPATAWQRLKGGASLGAESQQAAKRLAVWREERAQSQDIPREWVLPSNQLLQIARLLPRSEEQLRAIQELHPKLVQRSGKQLLALVAAGGDAPQESLWRDVAPLSGVEKKLVRRLMEVLKERAEHSRLAPALIANRRMVESLVRGERELPLLIGWRRDIVGAEMLDLLA